MWSLFLTFVLASIVGWCSVYTAIEIFRFNAEDDDVLPHVEGDGRRADDLSGGCIRHRGVFYCGAN